MLLPLKRISAAFGLLTVAASVATAQAPAPSMNQNQATANAVASALKSSPSLSSYRIDIEARSGVVTLNGSVPNASQKREALALVNKVSGVTGVVDQIRVPDARVRPVQYQMAMGGHGGMLHHGGGSYEGAPVMSEPTMVSSPDGSPVPEGPAGMGAPATAGTSQPNYAWPSYAPAGNFSAVGYPTAYPWQAWPNIGPFYPYPEVPQDWRAVTLRWDDGIWWLDFKKNYTRPFFTPYPFGLFAY
ncbi:BON domain-containing protein [Tundrisphaera lichenicola]|uniref:BON domain-containing protein n=1 Tax=Tundrisphaera lichenicola TaxID=2029860 RepID=UPI003EBD927F